MIKKPKFLTILLVVIGVLVLGKIFFYYTGPVCGIVVDANTGVPIEGAILSILWVKRSPMGGGWDFNVEMVTDKAGHYDFGCRFLFRRIWFFEVIGDERFLVYKEGYAAYSADGPEGSEAGSFLGPVQKYTRKNNVVKLQPLPSDDPEFHAKNINRIRGAWGYGPLMKKPLDECEKADKKMQKK